MSDIITNIAILASELPDPTITLFMQNYHQFPRFQALPFELRLIIWDLVRGRKLVMLIDQNSNLKPIEPTTTPITLAINHQTRDETILLYQQAVPVKNQNQYQSLHNCFFDPNVDTVFFPQYTQLERRFSDLCAFIYGGEVGFMAGCLGNIQYLEIGPEDWDALLGNTWQSDLLVGNSYMPSIFAMFRGLKELVIFEGGVGLGNAKEVRDCKESLERYFTLLEGAGVHGFGYSESPMPCSIPKIVVRRKTKLD